MPIYDRYISIAREAEQHAQKGGFPPENIRLLAVTKEQPVSNISELYDAGIREFAENRLPVLETKYRELPDDIIWHWIGKLQSNKVRKVLKMAKVIHSVDSAELLMRIEKIAQEEGLSPQLFIEINVSGEVSKSGIQPDELPELLKFKTSSAVIVGVMTMAPADAGEVELRRIFTRLHELGTSNGLHNFSMGMSNDYRIAAECGATVIRVGTAIFQESCS